MTLRVLLILLAIVATVLLLTRSPDGSEQTAGVEYEAQRNTEEFVCESRLQQPPFDGADGVALQFIRLDQFREQVLDSNGCWRLINFWATWCEPCREEMPALARLADRFREHGLEVITVNLEPPQAGDVVHQFLRDYQVKAANLRLDVPDTRAIAELLEGRWMGGIPFTVILDPGGEWYFWQHGLFDVDEVERRLESVVISREH